MILKNTGFQVLSFIEALEYSHPLLVTEYSIYRGTGGQGLHREGDGIFREIQLLCEADVTILPERRKTPS
jgi:N-methylhydantoinase B